MQTTSKPFVSYLRVPDIKTDDPFLNPQMQFATRNGKLRIREIESLDIKNIIRTNNIGSLENFAENLIFGDVEAENFEDKNLVKLIKTFQYALEFLNSKQNMLETTNQSLENDYNQLRNDSFALEAKLKENKALIQRYSKEKKEKEMLLVTYKSIIDYNTTEENSEIIEKIMDHNSNAKFYCHICSGKPFSSEDKLESHMKRRHLHQCELNAPGDISLEESVIQYGKKFDDMVTHFEGLIKENEDEQFKQLYMTNLTNMRAQNDKRLKEFENYIKNTLLDFKDLILKSTMQMPQQPIIIKEVQPAKENPVIKENDNKMNEELLKVTKSIMDLNNLIRSQYDNKFEQMKKDIDDLRLSKSQEKIIYQTVQPQPQPQVIVKEIEKKTEVNTHIIEKEPIHPIIVNDSKESDEEEKKSVPKEESKKSDIKEEETKKTVVKDNSNIFKSQNIIQEHTIILPPKEEDKFIPLRTEHNVEDVNGKLLPKAPEIDFSKTQKLPRKKKYQKIIINHNLNKTMTPSDQLDQFYADFNNRDNPIFEEDKPEPKHYLKKIIPEEVKQDEDKLKETLHNSLLATTKNMPSYQTYDEKSKKELISIIDKTLKNIEEVNTKNEVSQLYFDTVQKAIDWKLYEAEKEEIKQKMDNPTKLKRTRTKSSKASEVIKEANEEINNF